MTDVVQSGKLFLVIKDLHLLIVTNILQCHGGVRHGDCRRVKTGRRSAGDHTLVPLSDHALRLSFAALRRRAPALCREPILAIEAATKVQPILTLVEFLLHFLLPERFLE